MKKRILSLLTVIVFLLTGCASNIKDGVAFLEEEKYEEAIVCFEKDIAKEKNRGEAYRGIAIAQYELGDYYGAVDSFEKALENKEEATATIYSLMAASCLQIQEYEAAIDYYADALEMDGCTEEMKQEILFNEIAIYQELGEWDTVKEKVSAYVETYPDDIRMNKTGEFLETR